MLVIVWILAHATRQEFAMLGATFVVASVIYGIRRLVRH
jgi:hypothetical protein